MSKSAASPEEEATHEQLARLEQLEKQLQELKSQPSPEPPSSPWGSLPKESATQLQELESQLNEKGLILSVDEASIDYILERGYDKVMKATEAYNLFYNDPDFKPENFFINETL